RILHIFMGLEDPSERYHILKITLYGQTEYLKSRFSPAEPNSGHHCSEVRLACPRSTPSNSHSHPPVWLFDPPLPPGAPEDSEKAMKTKNVSVYKAQSCYHIEYKLLPGDTETVKVDILVFGPAAKIYREDETWLEGDQIWVGWAQKFNIGLNRDVLISLLPHKIRLQIWNTKDKLCSQARYERVRAFKLSQELSEDETECGEHPFPIFLKMIKIIEVHDRDQKSEALKTQTLGTASEHDIQFGGSVLQQKSSAINPHGIAKLNLSELLLGKKSLKVCLPVKCSPLLLDRERSPHKRKMSEKPMPQGHYYAANSQLKVKVEITCPFSVQNDSCDEDSCKGPFGRIVYLFGYSNSSAMTKLRSEILQINAAAFHLGSRSVENIETALSNYQMNFEHSETKDLDFVSGFHVIDKKTHIFVLEGLKQKTVKRLWEAIPMK
uniref:DUF4550 domain-containing protein n=1 Tax=Pundamilia nyererei TaxID=303518 RepID=A0A3B4FD13_9CICH